MADRVFSYVFRGDFGNLKAGLTAAQKNVSDLSGKMTALDKDGAKMRAGLSQIGDTAGKVGLAAAAGLGAVVLTAANFDKSMSAVSAVTGETAENMEKLREAAIKAGADTAFSATEAAAGIENLAKAGVSTSDILGGGLAGALDLAAAGEIGVAEAAEAASKAMTQFGLAGADVPHIADLLAAAAGKATGDVSDFTQALNQSGLVADQVGLSIEETTGGLAAFASAGLLGSDAGTSFKTMLGALTPNSNDAAKTMAALGLNAYDAQGEFVGLAEFAGQLQTALGDMSAESRQAALETIFGSDAVRAASVLYEQGEQGIRDWTAAVDDSGYAAEVAGERLDNLAGDWEEFTGSLETALIGAGEGSQGILRELVQGATDAVNAFNGLPSSAQNTATALLAITAVTGSSVWFGSKVITGVANTKAALADLGWTAGGTNGKLKSLAARGGGLVLMTAALVGAAEAIERLNGGFDAGRLERDFEALAGGEVTANMDNLVASLETLRKAGSVPMLADLGGELVTLFGALGNTNVDQAAQDIRALDEYLAGLVESGNAELAAAQFDALVEGLAAAMNTEPERVLGDVNDMLEQYGIALRNAGDRGGFFGETLDVIREALGGVQQATGEAGSAAAGAGKKMAQSAEDIAKAEKALEDARKAAGESATSFVNLGESLDDGKVSLREWLAELEKQANALRNFRVNAQEAAEKGLNQGLINSLQEAGAAGALRMRQLANASDTEIARANKAWQSGQREINRYVDAVTGVPKEAGTNLTVTGVPKALSEVRGLRSEIASLQDKTVTLGVRRVNIGGMGPQPMRAKGGPVYGPGTPTSDSIPAWLSTGEFVMKAAAVQKYGLGTMHAMNAMRLAGGGSADGDKARSGIDANNPLFGIGRNFISANEMGVRLSHLTLKQLAAISDDLNQLSKDSLTKLAKALGVTERHLEKELAVEVRRAERAAEREREEQKAHKDKLDAMRDELRAMKEAQAAYAAQVAGNFSTDIFGSGLVDTTGLYGSSRWNAVGEAASEQLKRDRAQAGSFEYLLRQLTDLGLDGDTFEQLAASGNSDMARYLIGLGADGIDQFEQDFMARQERLDSLGQYAGTQVFGLQIDAQAAAVAEQTEILREQRDLTRRAEDRADRAERRAEQFQRATERLLERVEDAAAKRGPDRVAAAVNGAVSNGSRKGRG